EIRSPGPFDLPGVVVRGNAGGTYYTGYCRPETGLVFIAKFVGGAGSNLQSAVGVVTNGSVMRLEVETIESSVSLTLYINGVQVVSAIDSSSPILTGQPGLLYSWN